MVWWRLDMPSSQRQQDWFCSNVMPIKHLHSHSSALLCSTVSQIIHIHSHSESLLCSIVTQNITPWCKCIKRSAINWLIIYVIGTAKSLCITGIIKFSRKLLILENRKAPHIVLYMLRYGGHAGFPMIFGAIFDKYHCCSIPSFKSVKMFFMRVMWDLCVAWGTRMCWWMTSTEYIWLCNQQNKTNLQMPESA